MARRYRTDDIDKQCLTRQKDFAASFDSWFQTRLQPTIEDNRRRYRMKLKDEEERRSRDLSCLPSTKSTSNVDRSVDRALEEYHGDPDAIAFDATDSNLDPQKEGMARFMTELFRYRSRGSRNGTFPFYTWHSQSLTNGFTDGIEAAMVFWKRESYNKKLTKYFFQPTAKMLAKQHGLSVNDVNMLIAAGQIKLPEPMEIDKATYKMAKKAVDPDSVQIKTFDEEVVTCDTWWIDSLRPGEDILWDFKEALLDPNLGESCLVKVRKTVDQLEQMSKNGLLDKFDRVAVAKLAKPDSENLDKTATAGDRGSADLEGLNRVDVWVWFEKSGGEWRCCFSVQGEVMLSPMRNINDVFWGGRQVDMLPIAMGTHKLKLWEPIGRGEPETIAPIEDEYIEHKNNVADATKQAIQGRWRISRNSRVNFDDLLNGRMFIADRNEVEKVDQNANIIDSLRAIDGLTRDMAELTPVGMENSNLVPRGTGRTLGAVQLALGQSDGKLSVQLITRNQTFFERLLYLIAQLEMSFETDMRVMAVASKRAGVQLPRTMVRGKVVFDLSQFEFDVEVQVNAGRGATTRQTKAQALIQLAAWRQQHGIPTDFQRIASMLNVLAGYDPGAFKGPPPQPPKPDVKANVNIDFDRLPPEMQQQLMQSAVKGGVTLNAQETPVQGGKQGGPPQPMGGAGNPLAGQQDGLGLLEQALSNQPMFNEGAGIQQGGQGGFD